MALQMVGPLLVRSFTLGNNVFVSNFPFYLTLGMVNVSMMLIGSYESWLLDASHIT